VCVWCVYVCLCVCMFVCVCVCVCVHRDGNVHKVQFLKFVADMYLLFLSHSASQ